MTTVNEKRVKDIMTPIEEYSTVDANSTVKEAIFVLKNSFRPDDSSLYRGHRTLLVYEDNKPAGILTFRALLTAIEPRFIKVDQWSVPVFWEGLFTERCREESKKKVKEIMTPVKLVMLEAEDTIIKAVHAMIKHKIGSLPVAKDGVLAGVVSVNEIFHEISELVIDRTVAKDTPATVKRAASVNGL